MNSLHLPTVSPEIKNKHSEIFLATSHCDNQACAWWTRREAGRGWFGCYHYILIRCSRTTHGTLMDWKFKKQNKMNPILP